MLRALLSKLTNISELDEIAKAEAESRAANH